MLNADANNKRLIELDDLTTISIFKELIDIYKKYEGDLINYEKENISEIDVGIKIRFKKRISEIDVLLFGIITGDFNPIHYNREIAKKTKFGDVVVHGMLTASLVSAMISRLPGIPVLLGCSLNFKAPVKIGDEVEFEGEIINKDKEKNNRYTMKVLCKVREKIVMEGEFKFLIWPLV